MSELSILGIVLATIASTAIGWLWFSKFVFGKIWMKHMNVSDSGKSGGMWYPLIIEIIFTILTAVCLNLLDILNFANLYVLAFLGWVGFTLPAQIGESIWGKQPWPAFFISTAYRLVSLIVMAAILSAFV